MQIINSQRFPTVTDMGIYGFFGEYRYLSNFEPCQVDIGDGIVYHSSEAAFMAQKTDNMDHRRYLATLTPSKAKAFGQTVDLRKDWDQYRVEAMINAVTAKFTQNSELAKKLLETDNKYLEETNNWGDRFWGVVDGIGKNMLGHVLMEVRRSLQTPIE